MLTRWRQQHRLNLRPNKSTTRLRITQYLSSILKFFLVKISFWISLRVKLLTFRHDSNSLTSWQSSWSCKGMHNSILLTQGCEYLLTISWLLLLSEHLTRRWISRWCKVRLCSRTWVCDLTSVEGLRISYNSNRSHQLLLNSNRRPRSHRSFRINKRCLSTHRNLSRQDPNLAISHSQILHSILTRITLLLVLNPFQKLLSDGRLCNHSLKHELSTCIHIPLSFDPTSLMPKLSPLPLHTPYDILICTFRSKLL